MKMYQQEYSILGSDMDITYHMTPNAVMLYFQDCFARFLTAKRLAAFDIIKQDLIWVISEMDMEFVKERPLWSSNIKVGLCFSEISSVRIYVNFWMKDEQDEVFTQGTSTWILMNAKTRRPIAAQEILKNGGIVANHECDRKQKQKYAMEGTPIKEIAHPVNVSDLDFNGHVCNRTYLSIAMGTLSPEFIHTYSPQYIHLAFNRETFLGETLTCRVTKGEGEVYGYLILNSAQKEVCKVYTEWKEAHEALAHDVSDRVKRGSTDFNQ